MHKNRWAIFSYLFFSASISVKLVAECFLCPPQGGSYRVEIIQPEVLDAQQYERISTHLNKNGFVVFDNISETRHRETLINQIDKIVASKIPDIRRLGFLDLYHDDALAQLRQDPRIYRVFTHIFNTEKLWVVYDRIIYQKKEESEDILPPHVDQNPITNPDFSYVQAMIALRDMDESTGTLAVGM